MPRSHSLYPMTSKSDDDAPDEGEDRRNRQPRVALHVLAIDERHDGAENEAKGADGGDQTQPRAADRLATPK